MFRGGFRRSILFIGYVLICNIVLTSCSSKTAKALEKVELGQKYLTELNYTEAITSFTDAINLDPENIPAYMGRAQAYRGTEQYAEAKADYTTVIEKTVEQPYTQATAYVGRAEVNELTEDNEDALVDYETAADLLGKIDFASLKELTEKAFKTFKLKVYEACARLNIFFGRYEKAEKYYALIQELQPDVLTEVALMDAETAGSLVAAYYVQAYTAGATGDLQGYVKNWNNFLDIYLQLTPEQLGELGLTSEEQNTLIDQREHTAEKYRQSAESLLELANDTGLGEEAQEMYGLFMKLMLYEGLQSQIASGKLDSAAEILRNLIDPDSVIAYRSGNYLQAGRLSAQAIESNSGDLTLEYRVHMAAMMQQGRYQEAEKDYVQLHVIEQASGLTANADYMETILWGLQAEPTSAWLTGYYRIEQQLGNNTYRMYVKAAADAEAVLTEKEKEYVREMIGDESELDGDYYIDSDLVEIYLSAPETKDWINKVKQNAQRQLSELSF